MPAEQPQDGDRDGDRDRVSLSQLTEQLQTHALELGL